MAHDSTATHHISPEAAGALGVVFWLVLSQSIAWCVLGIRRYIQFEWEAAPRRLWIARGIAYFGATFAFINIGMQTVFLSDPGLKCGVRGCSVSDAWKVNDLQGQDAQAPSQQLCRRTQLLVQDLPNRLMVANVSHCAHRCDFFLLNR